MISSRLARLVLCIAVPTIAVRCLSQTPFDLDTTFRTEIDPWYVSSVLPLGSGQLIVSGMFKFPGDLDFYSLARLNQDGTKDPSFYTSGLGGGKLVEWSGMYYVGTSQTVRRILPTGYLDPDWTEMNAGPYFSSLQGGDYHVYPDGRVLLTGYHNLDDTIRGFVGGYSLIWFSNQGYLDTTRTHRAGNGEIDRIKELSDGKFICAGGMTQFDGHPTTNVFRVHADGALDTTFLTTVNWGLPVSFLELPDGKLVCAGGFKVAGDPDTLTLARLLPNGALDPTFNNHFQTLWTQDPGDEAFAPIESIYPLDDHRYIITGTFDRAEGQVRGGIALIDTAGNLLNDFFDSPGCGPFEYFSYMYGGIGAITPDGNGNYYINGAYHGYNDGTTNDTLQRMVSRLYGLGVGIHDEPQGHLQLRLWPNPANDVAILEWGVALQRARLIIHDLSGRLVMHQDVNTSVDRASLDTRELAEGAYTIDLIQTDQPRVTARLIIAR